MSQNISEIKEIIRTGSNPINRLGTVLKQTLNLHLESLEIPVGKQTLFLKTILYYRLITKDKFEDLTKNDSILEDQLSVISEFSSLIQPGIIVSELTSPTALDFPFAKPDIFLELDIKIAKVTNGEFKGASHPFFMGLLYLNYSKLQNGHDLGMSVIHELAHQELFLLNMLDRLTILKLNHTDHSVLITARNEEQAIQGRMP